MLARFGLLALFLPLVACDSRAFYVCSSAPLGNCKEVDTCCDSEECFFEVDGKVFTCDEETTATGAVVRKDCDAAIAKLEDYCMVR